MKERPILMSGPNILSILEGRKTQTRRLVSRLNGFGQITEFGKSDTPGYDWHFRDKQMRWHDISHARLLECCPHGKPGEGLWVRENGWEEPYQFGYVYDADGISGSDAKHYKLSGWKRRPSIFMPRWASRILLEITDVRVERLQEISEEDAVAEGIDITQRVIKRDCVYGIYQCKLPDGKIHFDDSAYNLHRKLWESINGAGSWDKNPWVWVIQFRRINAAMKETR